MIFDIILQA